MFNHGESFLFSVLDLLISISLFLSHTHAEENSCDENNQICMDARYCPMFQPYEHLHFSEWPEEIQKNAQKISCNQEEVGGQTVLSVCCPTELNSDDCGIAHDDKIFGGEKANLFQFPWMALIRIKRTVDCGGSLISDQFVLTSAHCLEPNISLANILVVLGEYDIGREKDCIKDGDEEECAPEPQHIGVMEWINHPQYSKRYRRNDIALVRLKNPAILNDNVNTICLHSGTVKQRIMDIPKHFLLSGWGSTESGMGSDILLFARVSLVSAEECGPQIKKLEPAVTVDQSYICAIGKNKSNHRFGDSGGPLMYLSNASSRCVLAGVVQFGANLNVGSLDDPGVYANVTHYLNWIVRTVGSSSSETSSSSTTSTAMSTTISTTTLPSSTITKATETTTATSTTSASTTSTSTTKLLSSTTTTTAAETTTAEKTTATKTATTTISSSPTIPTSTTTVATSKAPTTTSSSSSSPTSVVRLILYVFLSIVVTVFVISITIYIIRSLVTRGLVREHKSKPEVKDSLPNAEVHLFKVKNTNGNIPLDDLEKGL